MTSNATLSNRAVRRRVDCQSGQSLMEFAIILPLLLLLLVGVIEIGRYAYASILVGNAARAGAAFGAQDHFTAGNPNGKENKEVKVPWAVTCSETTLFVPVGQIPLMQSTVPIVPALSQLHTQLLVTFKLANGCPLF